MSRAIDTLGSKLPKGWLDLWRQIGILIGVDVIYELGRGIADTSRQEAIYNGQQVIDFERGL
ncbi:MAG TPA: hypothetical protein VGG40_11120, partial [Solirubrobacterales bacterium]